MITVANVYWHSRVSVVVFPINRFIVFAKCNRNFTERNAGGCTLRLLLVTILQFRVGTCTLNWRNCFFSPLLLQNLYVNRKHYWSAWHKFIFARKQNKWIRSQSIFVRIYFLFMLLSLHCHTHYCVTWQGNNQRCTHAVLYYLISFDLSAFRLNMWEKCDLFCT